MKIDFNYDESVLEKLYNVECRIIDENENLIESLSSQIKLTNPYEINLNEFLPNTIPLTLNEFFATASNLILDAQKRSGIIESKIVKLVEEYPPETMDTYGDEVITFKVVSRKPAMMNRTATGLS